VWEEEKGGKEEGSGSLRRRLNRNIENEALASGLEVALEINNESKRTEMQSVWKGNSTFESGFGLRQGGETTGK